MANTYTQLLIHLIFVVEDRASLIHPRIKADVYKYITGIVQQRGHKLLAINGVPDHVHLLIGLRPDVALSDLVRDVKAFSWKHINCMRWVRGRFKWQEGFGGFSYSRSQIPTVIRYIENQEKHHLKKTFREEYMVLLKRFDVAHDVSYLFRWIEDEAGKGTVRS